ncbi:60S ribosomal protein L17-2 [Striga hermonthica]|uniref:60S ribosomal protein L17-2 n=1 Tax=Striga hermonthica TaxID=68872 RepID=A0A9N7RHV2_STRHE|nr:60S ribosomal protein L17-2 [Striga hermonthica]
MNHQPAVAPPDIIDRCFNRLAHLQSSLQFSNAASPAKSRTAAVDRSFRFGTPTRFSTEGHSELSSVRGDLEKEALVEVKGLDENALFISHIQVNQAQKQRCHTYRTHGRINPYMSFSCYFELILSEKEESVKKEPDSQLAAGKSRKA